MNSYYNILGVSKGASNNDIKKAFKKKALQFHPDHNKNDPKAEEKFKDVNEAYAVLKDKKKRKQYDQFGAEGFKKRYTQEDIFQGFDINEIFRGFGFGGRNEDTSVKIPPGISEGKKLRLTGKGFPGAQGGPPGDLYFKVHILPHPIFKRERNDIVVEHTVSLTDALLGTLIQVPTLEGEKQVKVPVGTQPLTKLRLRGLGIHSRGGGRGDQFVKINVTIPKSLTPEQVKLIESLKEQGL